MAGFNTPLRYPGGKGRLAPYVAQLIELNDLHGCGYVEPFAGGGGVAISLLLSGYVNTIYLNDVSLPIYAFWRAMVDHTEDLCRLIVDSPVNMDEWYRQRRVQENQDEATILDLGFSTLFLNRTNRSGIIRGGVIGGKEQKGSWKIDARFNKGDLTARIQKIATHRHQIHVYRQDAVQFITESLPGIPTESLVYLDPPYYVKGEGLYEHHYKHHDHEVIAELVQGAIQQPWIVSYDNHPPIRQLYSERRQQQFSLHYSANDRFEGQELMIFSDVLNIPPEIVPSRSALGESPIGE